MVVKIIAFIIKALSRSMYTNVPLYFYFLRILSQSDGLFAQITFAPCRELCPTSGLTLVFAQLLTTITYLNDWRETLITGLS